MDNKDKSYFVKLILSTVIFVSFLTVFGLMAQLVENKMIVSRESAVPSIPSGESKIYSIIKTKKIVFPDLSRPLEQTIETALFKIYPLNIDKNEFGYFEAYNNSEKIYTSGKNYNVNDLFAFEYNKNKYIIVGDYSGGAHCCTTDYIFKN